MAFIVLDDGRRVDIQVSVPRRRFTLQCPACQETFEWRLLGTKVGEGVSRGKRGPGRPRKRDVEEMQEVVYGAETTST